MPPPQAPNRRALLGAGLGLAFWPGLVRAQRQVFAPRPLQFPRDLGSHPDTAIEWWYLTGRLQAADDARQVYGFQLTFFRSRVAATQGMTSAFAAKQLIFAHAALTDVAKGRLRHDQRIARSSGQPQVALAHASDSDTDVQLRDWRLKRQGNTYQAQANGSDFGFDFTLQETQALLLQGDQGWSRKGPDPTQASFYYSLPQLKLSGRLSLAGQPIPVTGRAWFDHEWSQALLHPQAVGWDWIGMNLQDGSALTAFRLRRQDGSTLWAGGSWRAASSSTPEVFGPGAVDFQPQRTWRSPHSGASYPVQWQLRITRPQGSSHFTIRAVIDNQELDSRQSTGAIYWEGLSELQDSAGQVLGHGYLEMTGYAQPLRL